MATVGGRTGNLPDDQAAQNGVASEEERRYPSRFIWIASPSKCVFDKIHDGVSRRIEKIDVVVKILNSAPDQAVDVVLFLDDRRLPSATWRDNQPVCVCVCVCLSVCLR